MYISMCMCVHVPNILLVNNGMHNHLIQSTTVHPLSSLQPPETSNLTSHTVTFGDQSAAVSLNGPGTVNHTYQQPRHYEFRVISRNIAGYRQKSTDVYILGELRL